MQVLTRTKKRELGQTANCGVGTHVACSFSHIIVQNITVQLKNYLRDHKVANKEIFCLIDSQPSYPRKLKHDRKGSIHLSNRKPQVCIAIENVEDH